jgi:hypothetical protein
MRPSDANPYRAPVQACSTSDRPRHLNLAGRLLLALTFVAGVALFTYGGFLLGTIVGLERGGPHLTAPPTTKGMGLAPDLTGLVNGTAEFVASVLISTVGGLLVGAIVMSVVCLLVRAVAIRRVPWLTIGR